MLSPRWSPLSPALRTGIAYGPATLTLTGVELASDGWDVVEQAVLESDAEMRVITLDGDVPARFVPIPAGLYRFRAHARGRTTHAGLEVTEPCETYLASFAATTEPIALPVTLIDTENAQPPGRIPMIDETRVQESARLPRRERGLVENFSSAASNEVDPAGTAAEELRWATGAEVMTRQRRDLAVRSRYLLDEVKMWCAMG